MKPDATVLAVVVVGGAAVCSVCVGVAGGVCALGFCWRGMGLHKVVCILMRI